MLKLLRKFLPILFIVLLPGCAKDELAPSIPVKEGTWWNDEVFYEVFVRSFYDSDGNGKGDFKGLTQKLDYLNDGNPNTNSDLGVTGIWLMPIFPSPSYHGYDVYDFRTVNTQYGTMDDFREFVAAAHARGISVIIDFVINHTSSQHPWFTNSAQGASAEKRAWYIWDSTNPGYLGPWGQTVWHQKNGAYYYGLFWSGMPDLNYLEPKVTAEIKEITRFWYNDVQVDGFRIDAARHLIEDGQIQENTQATQDWWSDFYAFQKSIDKNLMTVGEVWTTTANIVPYTDKRLDYCFEFDLSYAIVSAAKNGNGGGLQSKIREVVNSYPDLQYGTFLTNHDQNRVIEELNGDLNKSKLAAGILLTLPGVPYLYYGEEVGMKGVKPDEDIRRPMQWTAGANAGFTTGTPWRAINSNYAAFNIETMKGDPNSLWNHYRSLINARKLHVALRRGTCEVMDPGNSSIVAFVRNSPGESMLVVHNTSSTQKSDAQISCSSSTLSPGTYAATEILTGSVAGDLVVGTSGSFSGYTPYTTLAPFGSYLIKLVRK